MAHSVDGDGPTQSFPGEIVGDQGVGRRRQGGLSHADTDAHQEHLPKIPGDSAAGGDKTPQAKTHGDDEAAVLRVCQSPKGDSKEGVEDGKGRAH